MSNTKTSWADASEEDLQDVDKDGFKYVTEYVTKDNKKYKVTKKIKLVKKVHRTNKSVQERKKWKPFGIAALGGELDDGSQISTSVSEPIHFERVGETALQTVHTKDEQLLEKLQAQLGAAKNKQSAALSSSSSSSGSTSGGAYRPPQLADKKNGGDIFSSGAGKYVPPSQRGASSSGDRQSGGGMQRDDDKRTVRVSNLGPDVTERDLRTLFARCGMIERCFLATDKVTRESKGFAFITFSTVQQAKTAIDTLNGRGLDHLILSVEWSKPSGPR